VSPQPSWRRAKVARDSHVGGCKRYARLARFLLRAVVEPVANWLSRLVVFGALAGVACSTSLPTPRVARQPRAEYLPVPYPPPAAFAETVPPSPEAAAVWVDGHWAWRAQAFVWQRGGWVVPPADAYFAHWRIRYAPDGTLLFAEEVWYDARLKPIPSPQVKLSAFTPPNELTPESQHGF
jgi:hypothetical protein